MAHSTIIFLELTIAQDDLFEIPWTFYALNDAQYDYYDAVSEAEQLSTTRLSLLSSENQLRSNGYHVLLDSDCDGLWIFHLFGGSEKLSELTENLGLIGETS